MHDYKLFRRILAMVLSIIMVLGLIPVLAMAQTLPIGVSGEIISFTTLPEATVTQTVSLGTSFHDLDLPETLTATVHFAVDTNQAEPVQDSSETEQIADISMPVKWAASPDYDGEKVGVYAFAAVLPTGYVLKEGVSLPEILVTVAESEALATMTWMGTLAGTNVATEAQLKSIFENGGAAVLDASITLTAPLVVPSDKTVILDLNGKTIDRGLAEGASVLNGYVIIVNGSLSLEDSQGTGAVTGGKKSGAIGGGGVCVAPNGTFIMNSGTIRGNKAEGGGGGVYVGKGGSFTMSGGSICGNTATYHGGGVYVEDNSPFTMTGGTISDNTTSGNGGGVYVTGSTFHMNSGTISGNTAPGNGGGVYVVARSSFNLSSGNISNNTASGDGGGVYVFLGSSFNMDGGTISDNVSNYGGGVYFDKANLPDYDTGSLVMEGGEICGNTSTKNGGGVYVANGSFSMANGTAIRNRGEQGGGVYVLSGTFTMENSTISENATFEALMCYGGGVYLANGSFTMNSGKVNYNSAVNGGGVYVFKGTFTMESGEINENSTYALDGQLCDGGGVYVNTDSTFAMKGGEICGNATSPWAMYNHGGGVYIYGGAFQVSGGVKILNNSRGGVPNNIYLRTHEQIIELKGQLTGADCTIGISTGNSGLSPLTVAQGSGYTISENDLRKFSRDTGGELNMEGNKITLPDPNVSYLIFLSYNANGGTGSHAPSAILESMPNDIRVASGENFSRANCSFAGWNTKADGSGSEYDPDDTLILTANTVLFAQWTIDTAEVAVTAPQSGAVPSSSAACSPSGITLSLAWKQGETPFTGNFDYNTLYSVDITLAAGLGCKFSAATAATVNGQNASGVQKNSDTELVVIHTFAKTGPRSAPTATLSQTSIHVANIGGSQMLTLNVAGIAEGRNPVTWAMSKTEDSGNILTFPDIRTGTLLNGALSLGNFTVSHNASGQPPQTAKVNIVFSGNESGEYADVPAPLTVTFLLMAGAPPAAAIDYINEKITGVSSEMEYIITDSAGMPSDWAGATTVTGTEIAISGSIPDAGSASKYIHIRYKGIDGSMPETIEIPARFDLSSVIDFDSWVDHNIENDVELGFVPWDCSYRINDGADMPGSSESYLEIPLEPGDRLTFWMPATFSRFKSAEITVTAPARLAKPVTAIDFAGERLATVEPMQYRLYAKDEWTNCTANMAAADFGWDGTEPVSVQICYPYTVDNYASEVQYLSIPARPAAPTINSISFPTAIIVSAETGVRYRLESGEWKTRDSNGNVLFTGLTANQSYTVYAQKTATDSAFMSEEASLSVSTKASGSGEDRVIMAGPTAMSLRMGYGATSTGVYTITGAVPVMVTKTSGDARITWNDATKKLDIAAGLTGGTYPVSLHASDGVLLDATLEFTLTVNAAPPQTVTSVTVSPETVSMQKGGTQQFIATVNGTNSPEQTVFWEVTGNDKAETSIDATGLLTVAADETASSLTITATSAADTGKSGSATIIVGDPPPSHYLVTVNGSYAETSGAGNYTPGATVTIRAGTRSNYSFSGWISDDGLLFATPNSATATFVMPAAPVTATANWSYNGDDGSGNDDPSTPSPWLKPEAQVTVSMASRTTMDQDGNAFVTITQSIVEEAIRKAPQIAEQLGVRENGIIVEITVSIPAGARALMVNLPKSVQDRLVKERVMEFRITSGVIGIGFDRAAINLIQRTTGMDAQVRATPVAASALSGNAKTVIGNRPAYNLTLSYGKKNLTNFGKGRVYVSMPYTPRKNEAVGYLYVVYVDGSGKVTRITDSVYDANSRSLMFATNHLSVYGVGYTAPRVRFTDIQKHWAKDSIEYTVGCGLFSGISGTKFLPDTAMDRGLLAAALGRLCGADVSGYKVSSFSDVARGEYYLPYIEWAYKNGIISGIGNRRFAPERAVTREEVALIMQNYAKVTGYKLPVIREAITFGKHSSDIGYMAAMKTMQQAGIMVGTSGNKFNPKAGATRAEVAYMLHRYIKLTIDSATAQG